ncbi:MAG: PAS domain-containing protein [Beijerinckiaceae bacterium]|nr:PAS domain-containing protein [Beijerinckiaceae bacterium]
MPPDSEPVRVAARGPSKQRIERLSRNRTVSVAQAALGFCVLILVSIASGYAFLEARQANGRLETLLVLRERVATIAKAVTDAETGQRGFLITGDTRFLQPYEQAVKELPTHLEAIRGLATDDRNQTFVAKIEALQAAYLHDLKSAVSLAREGDRDRAFAAIAEPATAARMTEFRAVTDAWREENLDRIATLRDSARRAQLALISLIVSGCVIILLLGVTLIHNMRRDIRVILDLVARLRTTAGDLALDMEEASHDLRHKSDELEATLARFRIATTAANITVFEQDRDRRYKWVSRGTPEKSAEEIIGLTEETILPLDSVAGTIALKQRVFETGEPASGDVKGTREGKDVWWHLRIYPLKDEAGIVTGIVGTSMNVTEQRNISNLIAERETRLQIATEAASLAIFEWDVTTGMATWDDRMFEIFGRRKEDGPLGSAEFKATVVHPDDAQACADAIRQGIATGSIERLEYRIRKPDGAMSWIRMSGRFNVPEDGGSLRLVGVAEDITAEKISGLEQERVLALLKAVTNSTPDLIYTKDRSSRLTFANPATLETIGKPWPDLAGRSDMEWHHNPEEARSNMANDRRVIENGRSETVEEVFSNDEGILVYLSTKAPLYNAANEIIGMVGISTDITERKANEEQRQFLMRELTHRSKNLLAVVQSMARQTATMSQSMTDFQSRFSARLLGLATSHDLLLQEEWRGASIRQLVISQLGHLIDMIDSRILLSGPDGLLQPEAAQNIGLALHELSTNAAKYGALSNENGQVYIRWGILPCVGAEERFFIQWQEDGGPTVTPPQRRGFGHSVMERLVARALDGKVDLDFNPNGVVWRLEIGRNHVMKIKDQDEAGPAGAGGEAALELNA